LFWSFPWNASFAIPPAAQPPDIPGWSALDAGVACLSRSSLHRQILPASARFGRRVYISASGRQFRYSTLAGLLSGGRFVRFGGGFIRFARNEAQVAPKSATVFGGGLIQFAHRSDICLQNFVLSGWYKNTLSIIEHEKIFDKRGEKIQLMCIFVSLFLELKDIEFTEWLSFVKVN
jgi:hypothetical protein